MGPRIKLFAASASIGAAITLAGLILVGFAPVDQIAWIVLWPVVLCLKITGQGPRLGPHGHEGTPVQLVAAIIGVVVAWGVYSSIVFLAGSIRRHHLLGNR
jgi:hypothetical protein